MNVSINNRNHEINSFEKLEEVINLWSDCANAFYESFTKYIESVMNVDVDVDIYNDIDNDIDNNIDIINEILSNTMLFESFMWINVSTTIY